MIPVRRIDDTRNPIVFNGLTFNSAPTGDALDYIELNLVTTLGQFNTVLDPLPSTDGSETTTVLRSSYVLRLDGMIRASTIAKLYDLKKSLALAFDPALASQVTSTSTAGVLPMDFDVPTEDSTYSGTGYIPSRYYVRSRGAVVPPDSDFTGLACMWTAEILVTDPVRYHQTLQAFSGAGTLANLGDYPTWPTITLTMAGAGSATYTYTYDSSSAPLIINLSGASNGDTYTIDCKAKTITRVHSGVSSDAISTYVSGTFPRLLPGSKVIGLTNTTNTTTSTGYRRAFVV